MSRRFLPSLPVSGSWAPRHAHLLEQSVGEALKVACLNLAGEQDTGLVSSLQAGMRETERLCAHTREQGPLLVGMWSAVIGTRKRDLGEGASLKVRARFQA